MILDLPASAGELESLSRYLDAQRAVLLKKTEGLDRAAMTRALPPSSLTLAGLLYHLALVEEGWMEEHFAGRPLPEPWDAIDWEADPEWEFRTAATLEPDIVRSRYEQACARSRAVVAAATGPDQESVATGPTGEPFTLRYVLLHLIEETARHAGHADLLRENVDGSTGE